MTAATSPRASSTVRPERARTVFIADPFGLRQRLEVYESTAPLPVLVPVLATRPSATDSIATAAVLPVAEPTVLPLTTSVAAPADAELQSTQTVTAVVAMFDHPEYRQPAAVDTPTRSWL